MAIVEEEEEVKADNQTEVQEEEEEVKADNQTEVKEEDAGSGDDVKVVKKAKKEPAASADDVKVVKKAKEPAAPAQPEAPPMPEMKMSQIIPMVAMMGLQKFNLEELGYVRYVEVGYVVVQVLCLAVMYLTYLRISKMEDDGKKIHIPAVKQMGQVVAPAKDQTAREYDMSKLMEAVKQPVMGFLITGGIYYKWGSLLPLVMQVLMAPFTVYESPITQIHLMGKTIKRPFPAPPSPFDGLMGGASAAPEVEADKKTE